MFLTFTLSLFCTIVIIVVIHYGALTLFLYRLQRIEWNKPDAGFAPKTMVLLPLRGADPSLPLSLEKILTQDYPNYHVRFILDSTQDPVQPLVESAIKRWGGQHAEIKIMEAPFSTCSLKNSALYYSVTDLDPSFEAVVIVDADTNPPKNWLKQLVEPLSDPRFPVATALRWYIPDKTNTGSLVRYLWNAAAIVQQNLYRIPWGGSLALRRDLFTKSNLLERWKHALSTDTLVKSAARQVQGNVAVVPSLFLVNRETCGLRSFHRWVKRQVFVCKLYHPAWRAILGQAVLITMPLLLLVGTFLAGLFLHDRQVVLWSLGAFAFYWAGVFGTLPFMERAVRQRIRQQGETVERWTFRRTALTFVMIPLTQGTYISALFWLHFMKRVEWRGVWYKVGRDKTVELIEYLPYAQVQSNEAFPTDESASL